MNKAINQIKQKLNMIDLVIQVIDARCINSSMNPELINQLNKPVLNIALKADLADLSSIDESLKNNSHLLIGTIKDKKFKKIVINKIYQLFRDKIAKLQAKGLFNPHFNIFVIGLPNVGKSSLINFLISKKKLVVENRPGVTKQQSLVELDKHFFLFDTPGVFVKKINDELSAYKLGLIKTIKKEILPMTEILKYAFEFYQKYYLDKLNKFCGIDCSQKSYQEFTNLIASKLNFFKKNNEIDMYRLEEFLFNIFSENKIAKVNYDRQ